MDISYLIDTNLFNIANELNEVVNGNLFNKPQEIFFYSLGKKLNNLSPTNQLKYLVDAYVICFKNPNCSPELRHAICSYVILNLAGLIGQEKSDFIFLFRLLESSHNQSLIQNFYLDLLESALEFELIEPYLYSFVNSISSVNDLQSNHDLPFRTFLKHVKYACSAKNGKGISFAQILLESNKLQICDDKKYSNILIQYNFLFALFKNSALVINHQVQRTYLSAFDQKNFTSGDNDLNYTLLKLFHGILLSFFTSVKRDEMLMFLSKICSVFNFRIKLSSSHTIDSSDDAALINFMLVSSMFCEKINYKTINEEVFLSPVFTTPTKNFSHLNSNDAEFNQKLESIDKEVKFKFPSQILCISLCFQNISIVPLVNRIEFVRRVKSEMKPTVDRMKELMKDAMDIPVPNPTISNLQRRIKHLMDEYKEFEEAEEYITLILTNESALSSTFSFYGLFSQVALKLFNEAKSSDRNALWNFLPDMIIENICMCLSYLDQVKNIDITGLDMTNIYIFLYDIISSVTKYKLVSNPHLLALIIDSITSLCYSKVVSFHKFLYAQADNHEFLQGLIIIFNDIAVDDSGSDDKYNVRYKINIYLRNIRGIPAYNSLDNIDLIAGKYYKKFINTILDDLSTTLNEGLTILKEIKQFQLKSKGQNNLSIDAEQTQNFARQERSVKLYLLLTESNLNLLNMLILSSRKDFLKDEILIRLVPVLNSNIQLLCGKNSSELKVENPSDYGWNPKKLLNQLIDILLNMKNRKFYREIARHDTTSIDAYKKANDLMSRKLGRSAADVESFKSFVFSVQTMQTLLKEEEEIYNDPPDEFVDPLTYTLMKDPVKLPSGMVMDRTIITQQLLLNGCDPFTRSPLTEEQLVPELDLKKKIRDWIKERKREFELSRK